MDVWDTTVTCPKCRKEHDLYVLGNEIPSGSGAYNCRQGEMVAIDMGMFGWTHGHHIPEDVIEVSIT